jgi:hypothetical protein
MIAQASRTRMSAPKVSNLLILSMYRDSRSRAVARKQQAIAKSDLFQKAGFR